MTSDRIEQLKRLLEQDPNDAFCLYGLAQEYVQRGENDRALEYFRRTVEVDPDSSYGFYHMARVQAAEGHLDDAKATLAKGIEAAQRTGDAKARGELHDLLDSLGN